MIYLHQGNETKARAKFNLFASQPETLLRTHNNMYKFLFQTALDWNLPKTPYFYKQYHKFFGFSCLMTNNVAIFYLRQGDLKQASEKLYLINQKTTQKKIKNCTHPTLLQRVEAWRKQQTQH
jgi:hypothetical protein